MTTGYAAVNYKGEILVNTISATKRAAMVNWLVTEDRTPIYQTDTDAEIERCFKERAVFRGMASVEEVSISLLVSSTVSTPASPDASTPAQRPHE